MSLSLFDSQSLNDWREVCDTGILLIFQLAEEAYYDIDYMISPSQTQSVIIKAVSVRDSKSSLNTCAQVMVCVVCVCCPCVWLSVTGTRGCVCVVELKVAQTPFLKRLVRLVVTTP